MKKFIAGLIVGVLIFACGTVFADSIKSLVGSKVDGAFEVYYQGKNLGEAPAINNSTYLPVRKITEVVGMQVKVEGKRIYLNQSDISQGNSSTTKDDGKKAKSQIELEISQLMGDIDRYNREISVNQSSIQRHEEDIKKYQEQISKASGKDPVLEQVVENIKKMIQEENSTNKEYEAKITFAQAEIERLKKIIAE